MLLISSSRPLDFASTARRAPSVILIYVNVPPYEYIGVWRDWGVAPNSGVFAGCLRSRFQKKEKMSSSHRARAIDAAMRGVPPEDVLRLVHPAHYLPSLKCMRDAYSTQAAYDGLELVKTLSLQPRNPVRPAPHWRRAVRREGAGPQALSGRATGELEAVVKVMGHV